MIRVLVLEDVDTDAELMVRQLQRAKLNCTTARVDTKEAFVAELESSPPDVVLADARVPGYSGMEAVALVRERLTDVPVLIVTGSLDEETAAACIRDGAADYVLKDGLVRLGSAVQGALDKYRLAAEQRQAEGRIRHLNGVLRSIRKIDQLIVREKDPQLLIQQVCDLLVETRYYGAAWSGLMDEAGALTYAAGAGLGETFERARETMLDGTLPPCGERARRQSEVVIIEEPRKICSTCPMFEAINGIGSYTARLSHGGHNYGLISVNLESRYLRDEEEVQLFHEVAEDIGLALHNIELEQTLQRSEEKWRMLVEVAPDIVMTLERDGTIQFVNRVVRGLSRDAVIGSNAFEHVTPEDRDKLEEAIEKVFESGKAHEYELTGTGPDGKIAQYSTRIGPIVEGGEVVSVLQITRDVTDRKQLEQQLIQAQKMESIGRLAGGMAHDFNNLLTVIMAHCEMADEHVADRAEAVQSLDAIREAGQRASGLTRQLLAFSRRQAMQLRVLDMGEVVRSMQGMLTTLLGEDVDLRVKVSPRLGSVEVDAGQLEQVLMNLAVNARDAMPDGGKLAIGVSNVDADAGMAKGHAQLEPGPYVLLTVQDNGEGMDEATRSKVFEPFFTTKGEGEGTGLGLSMVHGIVLQSRGFISLDSQPGEGTAFNIYLPRVDEAAAPLPEPVREPTDIRGSETILLVEDEALIRQVTAKALRRHGYQVIEAAEGEEALKIARQRQGSVHLLLTDVVMPGMSGNEVAASLRKSRPETKVLFTTGYISNTSIHRALLGDDAHLLRKPFSPKQLLLAVRQALG